jgi:hypothetical protein
MALTRDRLTSGRKAQLLGTHKGRKVYRIPVRVALNDSRACMTVREDYHEVIAYSAADAANWARDQYATRAETEVFAYGPKGGETHRYIGWYGAIGTALLDRPARSLRLDFDLEGQ